MAEYPAFFTEASPMDGRTDGRTEGLMDRWNIGNQKCNRKWRRRGAGEEDKEEEEVEEEEEEKEKEKEKEKKEEDEENLKEDEENTSSLAPGCSLAILVPSLYLDS